MEGRDLARSFTLAEFAARSREPRHEHDVVSLYPDQQFPEHKWGMAVDLSACVGCSACVLACQSENNVPVVGPEQVRAAARCTGSASTATTKGDPENPRVVHQPMLCQHCDSAPCEIVCPVTATTHSPDGLNQMAYNRCVGTRYCANNCPYKVRRFNFLEYTAHEDGTRDAWSTTRRSPSGRAASWRSAPSASSGSRTRSVRAKGERPARPRRRDRPACAAACPADAIVFGDLNDPASTVSQLRQERPRLPGAGGAGRAAIHHLSRRPQEPRRALGDTA